MRSRRVSPPSAYRDIRDPARFGFAAIAATPFGEDRLLDPLALSAPLRDLPDVLVRKPELSRNLSDDPPQSGRLLEFGNNGRKIHGGNQPLETGAYAEPRMPVNQKTRLRVDAAARPEIAAAIKSLREAYGLTQQQLAAILGSSQGAITRWERAIDSPPVSALQVLMDMVPEEKRSLWESFIGLESSAAVEEEPMREIPVLRDPAAAGAARAIDEAEVEYRFHLPRKMLPTGGRLIAVPVKGDSMSPVIESGYVVAIDLTPKDLEKLVGHIVAAREGEGLTLKWLAHENGVFLLLPENRAAQHTIRVLSPGGDVSIIGEVVWIGGKPKRRS